MRWLTLMRRCARRVREFGLQKPPTHVNEVDQSGPACRCRVNYSQGIKTVTHSLMQIFTKDNNFNQLKGLSQQFR